MAQSVRLGVFVLVTLAILALLVFLVGNTQSRFQSTYRLEAQFQNVSGLEDGADVRIGGVHKGTVHKIELPSQPNGKITVVMDLSRDTRNLVKQDSVASINSEGLVGNKYVEVSFGSMDSPNVPAGGMIGSQPPLDISDLIGKTNEILDSAKGTLDNVGEITAKINGGRGTIGALINNKAIYQQATAGVAALHEDADALKHNFLLRGYFNKRGFADPNEIRKYAIAQLPPEPPQKTFSYQGKRLFDKDDSAKIKDDKSLNEAGQYLQTSNPGLVVIEASAGPKGQSDQDKELTQARAYAVRSYLLDHFKLDDQRLKILGTGKSDDGPSLKILTYNASQLGKP